MADTFKRLTTPTRRMSDMSIEWEFMPSLRYLLQRREPDAGLDPMWADTQPSLIEDAMPSDAFAEPLPGMTMREVTAPEIFQAFFGPRDMTRPRA